MRWALPICETQYKRVKVDYLGLRGDVHRFRVSSLSRPGYTHLVLVQLSSLFNKRINLDAQKLIYEGLVKAYSTDEWFKYGGCAYYHTQLGVALRPEFRQPMYPQHDCVVSHTEWAVLDLLARLGPGVLRENFSTVLSFDDDRQKYVFG